MRISGWKRWFAWRPVEALGRNGEYSLVWLEWVYRERLTWWIPAWTYRTFDPNEKEWE